MDSEAAAERLGMVLFAIFSLSFGICFHAGCSRVERTIFFMDHVLEDFFAQLVVCNASIWKVSPYPFVNLFQLLGAWSFKFSDNVRMNTTSSLVFNDIKHVMHFAKEVAFQVCQKGSELYFEDTVLTKSGRSILIWPLCRFFTISGHLGFAVNVTIKCGFPMRVTTAIASNCFLLRFAGAPWKLTGRRFPTVVSGGAWLIALSVVRRFFGSCLSQ